MFFEKSKDARIYANIQNQVTGYNHFVVPCKKYLCPPREYFGKDYINGYTVILK